MRDVIGHLCQRLATAQFQETPCRRWRRTAESRSRFESPASIRSNPARHIGRRPSTRAYRQVVRRLPRRPRSSALRSATIDPARARGRAVSSRSMCSIVNSLHCTQRLVRAKAPRASSCLVGWASGQPLDVLAQLSQFALVTAGQNRKTTPGLGVEVFVVDVKRRGVPFAFPLVLAPESEKTLDPRAPSCGTVYLGNCRRMTLKAFQRRLLVANGRSARWRPAVRTASGRLRRSGGVPAVAVRRSALGD